MHQAPVLPISLITSFFTPPQNTQSSVAASLPSQKVKVAEALANVMCKAEGNNKTSNQ